LAIRRRRIYGGFAAVWRALLAAKRACRNGIVKNQQRSDSEPLHAGMGESSGTLNLHQSREKLSGGNFPQFRAFAAGKARLTPAKPGLPDEVRQQTCVSKRDREKSTASGFGTVANQQNTNT
jgi:hypothetical protein